MEMLDARRLTGPNLFWEQAGALLDVRYNDTELDVIDLWKDEMLTLQKIFNWQEYDLLVRHYQDGSFLLAGGPIDQLYAVIEAGELAWQRAVLSHKGQRLEPLYNKLSNKSDKQLLKIRECIESDSNPRMIELKSRAEKEGVTFLWDDDFVSLGMGTGSQTWPADKLPEPDTVDWSNFSDVPVAVVTGTNGKSTNVRLICKMVQQWGKIFGNSSTDWIRVGDDILDKGDYSGPGGARTVLRDTRTQIGVLEVARGGLLRRGAGINRADVALITNVAEDHMGEYGINRLDDLIEAKMVVNRLVDDHGVLVLNADDEGLVRFSSRIRTPICWFTLNNRLPLIEKHISQGRSASVVEDGRIVIYQGSQKFDIAKIKNIPITLNGLAEYNISNCLSAAAVAFSLGIPSEFIASGLTEFDNDPATNPGRGNYFDVHGIRVLVDFAHNIHGLTALLKVTERLKANRRLLTIGNPGDRRIKELKGLARVAANAKPDRILVTECVGYERDLGPGAVPRIIHQELLECGIHENKMQVFNNEMEGVKAAFEWAKPGDLLILLVLAQREKAIDYIMKLKAMEGDFR